MDFYKRFRGTSSSEISILNILIVRDTNKPTQYLAQVSLLGGLCAETKYWNCAETK